MANSLICGFEVGNTREMNFIDIGTATLEVITAARRTGDWGLHVKAAAGQASSAVFSYYNGTGTGLSFAQSFRFYMQVIHLPGSTIAIAFTGSIGGLQLNMDSTGHLIMQTDAGNATSSNAFTVDGLFHLVTVNNGYNAGAGAQVAVDGVTWASQTTGTAAAHTSFRLGCGSADTVGGFEAYFDDVLVDNASATLPAGGAILSLSALGDTSVGSWTAGAGGTTNLFAAVDYVPVGGVADGSATNTSQIHNSNATGNQDYTVNCFSGQEMGLTPSATLNALQAIACEGTATATARAGALWVASNPAQTAGTGTFQYGTSAGVTLIVGTFGTGWATTVGPCAQSPSVTLTTAPTMTIRKVDANAQVVDVCLMGIYYDFQPGAVQNSFICGFELGSNSETNSTTGTGTWAVISGARRTGNYGLHVKCTAGQNAYWLFNIRDNTGQLVANQQSVRFYMQVLHLPGTITRIFSNSNKTQSSLLLLPTGALRVSVGGLSSSTSTNLLSADGLWHKIAVNFGYNSGGGGKVYVDDVLWANYDFGMMGLSSQSNMGCIDVDTVGGFEAYFDDVLIANGAATIPSGGSVFLLPVSDSSISTWTGGAGGVTNLWDAVNNHPPGGVADASATNTSQIRNPSSSAGQDYKANCQSYASAGIDGAATINAVSPFLVHGSALSGTIHGGAWIDSNPSQGVLADEFRFGNGAGACGTWPNGWVSQNGIVVSSPAVTVATQPVVAVRKNAASSAVVELTLAALYVDYQPGSPGVARAYILD